MSINTYSFHEAAVLLIDENIALAINMAYNKDTRPIADLQDSERRDYENISDALDVLQSLNVEDAGYCSEFTGNEVSLYDREMLKKDDPKETSFDTDDIAYVFAERTASLFHAAYTDFAELVAEFREKMKNILPQGFPIEKHIVELNGTYFC